MTVKGPILPQLFPHVCQAGLSYRSEKRADVYCLGFIDNFSNMENLENQHAFLTMPLQSLLLEVVLGEKIEKSG